MSASLSLATRALRGFLWNGSASLIQLGVMLALYALLPLEGLGHFEWALALVMLLALVGDLGLGAALVQLPDADEEHFDTAFWTCLSWGLLLAAAVVAATSWLALFLGGEDPHTFARVLRTLCLTIPFAALAGLLRARLQRALDFRAVALSELVSVLTFACTVTILLLWRPGLGVLIPVLGSVVRELGLFSSLALAARWRPRLRFRPQALRQILGFALHFTGSRVVALVNAKIAYVFIYVPLGPTAQAYYSLAERLTLHPLMRLATTIQRVCFPTFSTIVDDDPLLRRGYLSSVQGLLLGLGPLLAGIFAFAPEIAALLDKEPMGKVLRFLAVATLLKAVGTMASSLFMAKGKANWSFYWSLFSMGLLIPALYFYGLPRGVEGVAWVVAVAALPLLLLSQHLVNRLIGISFKAYLAALVRPVLVVTWVAALLLLVRPFLLGSPLAALVAGCVEVLQRLGIELPGSPLAVLIVGAALGIGATAVALFLFARALCRTYWQSLRRA